MRELVREHEAKTAKAVAGRLEDTGRTKRGLEEMERQVSTACVLPRNVGRTNSVLGVSELASVTESSTETGPGEAWKEQECASGGSMKRKLVARFSSEEEEDSDS